MWSVPAKKEGRDYMARKMLGFSAFVLTGVGLMASTLINGASPLAIGVLLPVAAFYVIALSDHLKELRK